MYVYGAADVDENVGSSHAFGVGASYSGGGWGADGSTEMSVSDSAGGSGKFTNNVQISNKVNLHVYRQTCHKGGTGPLYYNYTEHATSYNALLTGASHLTGFDWDIHDCHYYTNTSYSFHKTKGQDITYSGGFQAPFVNLSAHASYSGDTTITWRVPKEGMEMCGSSSAGWVSSNRAGSEAYPSTGCVVPARRVDGVKPDC